MEHRVTTLYTEDCDCYERFGKCMHFNGGNYHRRDYLHSFHNNDDYAIVLEETDTRESSSFDNLICLTHKDSHFELVSERDLDYSDIIAYFREGEARIIAQSNGDTQ